MSNFVKADDNLKKLEKEWETGIHAEEIYDRENEAKLRAVTEVENYEEFRNIIKACHLKPLSREEILELRNNASSWKLNTTVPNGISILNKVEPDAIEIAEDKPELVYQQPETSTQFIKLWKDFSSENRGKLLREIPLKTLEKFLNVDSSPDLIKEVIYVLNESEDINWKAEILKILYNTPRLTLNILFFKEDELNQFKILLSSLNNYKSYETLVKDILEKCEITL